MRLPVPRRGATHRLLGAHGPPGPGCHGPPVTRGTGMPPSTSACFLAGSYPPAARHPRPAGATDRPCCGATGCPPPTSACSRRGANHRPLGTHGPPGPGATRTACDAGHRDAPVCSPAGGYPGRLALKACRGPGYHGPPLMRGTGMPPHASACSPAGGYPQAARRPRPAGARGATDRP